MARRGENIYKRKDGRWEGRYRVGFDECGKSKYRSVYARTYQEIKEKLSVFKSEALKFTSSGKMTVKMLFEEWIDAVRLKVKASTYANYRQKINKYLIPEFGSMAYEKLTEKAVHKFIERKLGEGLSAKYISDIIIVFKSMSKYMAKLRGFKNALKNVILPKAEKKEITVLSDEQQKTLCQTAYERKDSTGLAVLICYYTGLRIGEICGLKWSDIDFEKRIFTVRRTIQRIAEKTKDHSTRLLIGSPKSISSIRVIPLPDFVIALLHKYKCNDNFFVLSESVTPIEPRTLQYRFKSLLKKANLPSVKFHSLRHMFASNCVSLGFDIKTLSEILGHSSAETTLNRYVHSSLERKYECMKLLKAIK